MIKEQNVLTKFHEDWKKNAPPPGSHFHDDQKINVAFKVLTMKNAPPPGGNDFQKTRTIFELILDVIRINPLTKFHEDWTINITFRPYNENAPPPGDIIGTNLLTKFHEDRTINVAFRVLTRQMLTMHKAQQIKGNHKSSP
ncbi:hypothetical protein DPMN_118059 [Dreissena polymorpha]|uniref:Uncharacterized protein n=1 Tax=Dreissena polymorpha TaxID=45954 RepID=A0A9D4GMF4_DREPO|nr:hypothetical protein DPMN_118059 [Dreissena polymorpha]